MLTVEKSGSRLGAILHWLIHGDEPERPSPTRLETLIAEREQLARQIGVLRMGPVNLRDYTPQSVVLADDLTLAWTELDREIAEIDPAQAGRPPGADD